MKRAWLVLLCCLLVPPFLIAGCGESKEEMLSQYGVATDEEGQYVWRFGGSERWHGELVREEDGSAVFYGRNHDFERYFDASGNSLYDVGTNKLTSFDEKMNINSWAAAGEPWPEDAPIPLPENAYAVNMNSFSYFKYGDSQPAKATIGKLSPDEISAYIRLLENDGWQKSFDSATMAAAPAELALMVKWYLGKPGEGDIILEKDSVFVIVEPTGYPEYSVIYVTFCYARLPDASPLPQPEGAAVKWVIADPYRGELYGVCFAFDEALGTVEGQTYCYLRNLELDGVLTFGSYSDQAGWVNGIETDQYGLSAWHGEYTIEGNCMIFDIH